MKRCSQRYPYFTIDLISDKGPGVPEEQDWDNVRKLAEFLGHFADVTKLVSASLSVTAYFWRGEYPGAELDEQQWSCPGSHGKEDGRRV
jgi:hypothetical protein